MKGLTIRNIYVKYESSGTYHSKVIGLLTDGQAE
jgi:hypothetical protein